MKRREKKKEEEGVGMERDRCLGDRKEEVGRRWNKRGEMNGKQRKG